VHRMCGIVWGLQRAEPLLLICFTLISSLS
jgi:hypothetical protein